MNENLPREISWMGSIPEDYTVTRLGRLVEHVKKKNKGHLSRNLLSLSYGEIKSKNIDTADGLLPESFETYNLIEKDDIVLRLTDLQNDKRSLRSAISTQEGIITSAYITIRPTKIYPRFLAYYLRLLDNAKVFYSLGSGLRQSLSWDDAKLIPVVVPPFEKQKRIADQLDRELAEIDAFSNDLFTLSTLVDEKMSSNLHSILYRHNPNCAPLCRFAKLITGKTPSGVLGDTAFSADGISWFQPGDISQDKLINIARKRISKKGEENQSIINKDSPFIVGIGGTIGKVGFSTAPFATNQQITTIVPRDNIDSRFLFFVLNSNTNWIHANANSSTLPIINNSILGNLPVPLFSSKQQEEISTELVILFQEMLAIKKEISIANKLIKNLKLALVSNRIENL